MAVLLLLVVAVAVSRTDARAVEAVRISRVVRLGVWATGSRRGAGAIDVAGIGILGRVVVVVAVGLLDFACICCWFWRCCNGGGVAAVAVVDGGFEVDRTLLCWCCCWRHLLCPWLLGSDYVVMTLEWLLY